MVSIKPNHSFKKQISFLSINHKTCTLSRTLNDLFLAANMRCLQKPQEYFTVVDCLYVLLKFKQSFRKYFGKCNDNASVLVIVASSFQQFAIFLDVSKY